MAKSKDQFSPEEAKKRFEAALKGARVAGHKPMSEISPLPTKSKKSSRKDDSPKGKAKKSHKGR